MTLPAGPRLGPLGRISARDRQLGMGRRITRRDFIDGVAATVAVALAHGPLSALERAAAGVRQPKQDQPGYYPPLLNGLRGSHAGSFEAAHALRDGATASPPEAPAEDYDLVVVGAGISGLAAAHFFQSRTGGRSRILILDNHDDFGGHAKRNEFNLGGRIQLLNGGTLEVDSPHAYSATADGLLKELGVDIRALVAAKHENRNYYQSLGLRLGAFLDAETFGTDQLIVGMEDVPMRTLLRNAQLPARPKRTSPGSKRAGRAPARAERGAEEGAPVADELPRLPA